MGRRRYTISEMVDAFDTTPRTLRYYEELGLLAPERQGSRRLFTDRDRVRMKLILRGRRLGFSLSEIREMLELYEVDRTEVTQLREVLRRGRARIAEVEAQIADLELLRSELRELEAELQRLLDEKTGPDSRTGEEETRRGDPRTTGHRPAGPGRAALQPAFGNDPGGVRAGKGGASDSAP